jgi:hypothetical protein
LQRQHLPHHRPDDALRLGEIGGDVAAVGLLLPRIRQLLQPRQPSHPFGSRFGKRFGNLLRCLLKRFRRLSSALRFAHRPTQVRLGKGCH